MSMAAALRSVALVSALIASPALVGPASAQTATSTEIDGVVELFTSQGCSYCPPADTVLSGLAGDERLLTLSYHVDYWDYIGWKDPLGSLRNTERQRAYAKAMGYRSIFTPQMVVNGSADFSTSDTGAIRTALDEQPLPPSAEPDIRLSKEGSTLHISAVAPASSGDGPQTVLILVTYRSSAIATDVERGENAGQQLVSSHAVRDWQVVATVGVTPVELDMPIAPLLGTEGEGTHCAVLLQVMEEDGSPGPILAAAKLAL